MTKSKAMLHALMKSLDIDSDAIKPPKNTTLHEV